MSDARKARDLELLDAIDKLPRSPFEGEAWRVVRESRDVLLASRVGARWDPGTYDVLYTSLDRAGALEEVYFHLSRQPVFPSVPFQLHRLRICLRKALRLEDMESLRTLGVDTAHYGGADYVRTQAISDCAFFLGFDGLIVRSARSPCLNAILFADRVEVSDIEVQQSELVDWKVWRRSR